MDLSHLVKYCRYWKSGSQTALSTTVLKRLCNRLCDPGIESHAIPPLSSFSGIWDHNQGSVGWDVGRVLMPLMWKTRDLLVGKFSQNFGAIFWNTLGELGKCLGICSALMQWSWCRLPYIPMKALHSQYFPIPYVIISYINEQRDTSKGEHALLPNLSKQTKWICSFLVLEKAQRNEISP